MKYIRIIALLIITAAVLFAIFITRDGKRITPHGEGNVVLESGTFEAFPLPDYAAQFITDDYKSYFVEIEPGIKIHVLEVGEGYPVYMQHGNPTSGFLYRKIASALPKDRVRIIMPTLAGLGFSSKIPASEHTVDKHIRWMNGVLEQLQVKQAVYVGQDWGGPVGMGALSLSPDILQGVVIMNTGLNAPTEKRDLSSTHARVKTPVIGELAIEVFLSIFDQLHAVQGDPNSISAEVADLYGRPVTESGNAKAPLALMRMVPDGPDHPSAASMRAVETYVKGLDVPAEIIWGMNDPILAAGLPAMQENFPEAAVLKTEAGHFLQEEVPGEIAAAVMRLVERVDVSDFETIAVEGSKLE